MFVALPSSTYDGSLIFGKNSDREPNEAQALEFYPGSDYPTSENIQCTYIAIPQVRHTYGIVISRPFWMWGAEMGANDQAVVIGNVAVYTRMPAPRKPRLLGMDMLRLALERAGNAGTALEVLVRLLSDHGQGGPCGYTNRTLLYHNSFLIADPTGAWILETAGHLWAASRVKDRYSVSNGLTIEGNYDEGHPDLIKTARQNGWLKKGQEFSFSKCYSNRFQTLICAQKERRNRSEWLLDQSQSGITVGTAMSMLRDHGGAKKPETNAGFRMRTLCSHAANPIARNAAQTAGSLVAHMKREVCTLWATGTSAPCTGVFKPLWFGDYVLPDLGPAPGGHFDHRNYWWRHERFHRRVLLDYARRIEAIKNEQTSLEEELRSKAAAATSRQRFALTQQAFSRVSKSRRGGLLPCRGFRSDRELGRSITTTGQSKTGTAASPILTIRCDSI
jgi:dipeptidase